MFVYVRSNLQTAGEMIVGCVGVCWIVCQCEFGLRTRRTSLRRIHFVSKNCSFARYSSRHFFYEELWLAAIVGICFCKTKFTFVLNTFFHFFLIQRDRVVAVITRSIVERIIDTQLIRCKCLNLYYLICSRCVLQRMRKIVFVLILRPTMTNEVMRCLRACCDNDIIYW